MIDVNDHGLTPNDINFDNTPLFNSLVQSLGSDRDLYFPAGAYYFNTAPDIITIPLTIRGCGINNTNLLRNYNETDLGKALIHTKSTLHINSMAISAAPNCVGGGAIKLDGLQASSSVLRDLYITAKAGGNWGIPVTLYGPVEMGIRGCCLDNLQIFAATVHLIWCLNVRGLTANMQCYPAGGTVDHITIQSTNGYRPSNISITSTYLTKMYLYDVDNLRLTSAVDCTILKSNCSNIIKTL